MRRVRSQLDNLAPEPQGNAGMHYPGHVPVGQTQQTDEVQRRIDAMNLPSIYGNQVPNAPMNPYQQTVPHPHPQYLQQMQPMAQAPMYSGFPAPQPQYPAYNPEMENIKASLDRLSGKLQGIVETRSNSQPQENSAQNTAATVRDTAAIIKHFQHLNAEIGSLKKSIAPQSH